MNILYWEWRSKKLICYWTIYCQQNLITNINRELNELVDNYRTQMGMPLKMKTICTVGRNELGFGLVNNFGFLSYHDPGMP